MGAICLRVRVDLRRRWPAWLALSALIGVFAGGVIAISAGAIRTNTAYPRLLAATRAPDLLVVDRMPDPSFATFSPARLAGLPQVSESGQLDSFVVLRPSDLNVLAPSDDVVGNRFYTEKLLAGRLPDPTRPQEVAVSLWGAEADHIRVGAVLRLQLQPASGSTPVPVRLRVVGIDAAAGEFPPEAGAGMYTVSATPAFVRAYGAQLATSPGTLLRLTHGAADLPAVQSEMNRMAGGKPAEAFLLATQGANTQRSIHLQAVALWVLALLLALAGILIVAQILARQSALESGGYPELRALGMTGRELWAVGLARVVLIGAVAAVVAGVFAAAASPIFPLGLAHIAEPHPGFHLDAATVLFGMAATLMAVLACGLWPTWRTARDAGPLDPLSRVERRRSSSMAAIQRLGAPVSAATGIGFALARTRGRSAVPVRSTITAAVMGVAALTAAIVFSASLTHLMNTPRLYGDTWDALVTSLEGEGSPITEALPVLRHDPAVEAISIGYSAVPMQINGSGVAGLAFDTVEGPLLQPTPLEGRAPSNPGEVMLGPPRPAETEPAPRRHGPPERVRTSRSPAGQSGGHGHLSVPGRPTGPRPRRRRVRRHAQGGGGRGHPAAGHHAGPLSVRGGQSRRPGSDRPGARAAAVHQRRSARTARGPDQLRPGGAASARSGVPARVAGTRDTCAPSGHVHPATEK